MNKFYGGLLAAFFGISGLQAQTLQTNKTQLAFGNATEIAPVTQQITLSNPLNYAVNVKNIRFFTIYGEPAFSVSNTFPINIPAGGTQTLTVTFSPLHNIAHNTEMVIETDSHGGDLAVDLTGQGKYSKTYYNNSENKSEEQLKTALKGITSNPYTSFSYNAARDKMFMEFDNWKVNGRGATVNTLECIYTGRKITGYTSRSQAQNSPMNFNTEHTFPQGYFNEAPPMVSDMHHLFPSDNPANGSRSNYRFGMATTPYKNDAINTPSHLGANNHYEPRDAQKGATARAMLYFVIRYSDYQNFFAPQEAILKTWNHDFAPTAVDVKRNDDIHALQRNRNPFVDYPQLASRITNFVATSAAAPSYELYNSPVINYGTIPANTTFTYNFVLVNNGNQTMNFSGATLSKPAILTFAAGTNTTFSIAPGEAQIVKVNLKLATTDSISEILTLQTNIPNRNTLNIPIYANKKVTPLPLGAGEELAKAQFNLYPNPVNEELIVARGNQFGKNVYALEIVDALGKTVKRVTATGDVTTVNVAELKRGVYFLRINSGAETQVKKFIKL
ncbi:endonuclease [Adhaeribacter sp. BT258]|uniref:Endonuclease n=1 Tax=Adhaeribacter terrigena TaxID=2793070 RepID=A0ABS1BYB4_9BACT|nr:endonuclease [Adhaeribacter terrigena]MBK0402162.1 endonuclease [Adhaeribacter terrigena]